jgi:hypothetical protein
VIITWDDKAVFEERTERRLDIVQFFSERLGILPEERQAEVLRCEAKRVIVNCSRQWGKSTMAAGKALHRAYERPGSLILAASPTERQSAEFVRKARTLAAYAGERVRGDGYNKVSLQLENGSRIVGLPGSEATVRGFSAVSLLIIDEAARVGDSMYLALRPMLLRSDGDLWMMSTPMGKRGFFYETWANGEGWARFQTPVTECARVSEEFLAEERAVQGDEWFRREYLCEFLDSGLEVFGMELVQAALEDGAGWGMTGGPVFIGLDLGKLRDYTAIVVLERAEQRVAWMPNRFEGFHVRHLERMPLGTAYTRVVERIRELVRDPRIGVRCKVVVDATGLGGPVVDMLRKADLGCGLTAVTITGGERANGKGEWWNVPRHELIMGVKILLENGDLKIERGWKESGRLVRELVNLEGGGGEHDDLVMALGLGCWGARLAAGGYKEGALAWS